MSAPFRAMARKHLDSALAPLRGVDSAPPADGWIRSIRTAIGMSTSELAARAGVSKQRISQYEAAEQAGTIKLETLERVAAALGAELQYALVPTVPLTEMVARRARELAELEIRAVDHSMALEDQRPRRDIEHLVAERARALEASSRLWASTE